MKFYTWVWHPDKVMSSKEDPEGLWVSRSAAEETIRRLRIALKDALDALGEGDVIVKKRERFAETIAKAVIVEYDGCVGYDGPSESLVNMCQEYLESASSGEGK
jgi:hypothetical protein